MTCQRCNLHPKQSSHPNARYCAECKLAAVRETKVECTRRRRQKPDVQAYEAEYNRSEAGRANFARYRASPKRAESLRRYNNSPKRTATSKRYNDSDLGRANSDKMHHLRRARQRGAEGGWFNSLDEQVFVYQQWGGCCAYCNQPLKKPHWDHIEPLSRGGSNYVYNLAPACKSCNSQKHNKMLTEWRNGSYAAAVPARAAQIFLLLTSTDLTSPCGPACDREPLPG